MLPDTISVSSFESKIQTSCCWNLRYPFWGKAIIFVITELIRESLIFSFQDIFLKQAKTVFS